MSKPLTIGFINNFAGPSLGGGEVQLLALMNGLAQDGTHLRLVCAAGSALEAAAVRIPNVTVAGADFRRGSVASLSILAAKAFEGADIVQGTGFLTNLVARRAGRRIGARVVNTVHVVPGASRLDGESAMSFALRRVLDQRMRTEVDRFVAVSQAVADGLVHTGVHSARVVVIPNGIDVAAIRARAELPLQPDLPEDGRRVGFVGRLERVKGCEFFIGAAGILATTHPEVRFVVAGTGSAEARIWALAKASPAADRIHFLGYMPNPAPLMAALDVLCVPSLSEASGLTAIEGLALGIPVVASAVGGLPDVVVDGSTGLLVPPGDSRALALAIGSLLDDPELAHGLAVAGSQHVEAEFSVVRMVAGYRRLYEELVPGLGR